MEHLKQEHLLAMLTEQTALLDEDTPGWRNQEQHFLRDAYYETALMVRAAHYAPDAAQAKAISRGYAMGIWQQLMSEWIINIPEGESIEDATGLLMEVLYAPEKWTPEQEATLQKHTDFATLCDAFVHLCSANSFNVKIFERMLELMEYPWDQLYQEYASTYLNQGDAP